MQIKKGIGKWSLFALGWSCVLSFGGSAFGAQIENGKIDTSKKVEISWYFAGNGEEEDTEKVEAAINNYIEKYTDLNCTLKLNCMDWVNYYGKMPAKIASGESFDICFTSSWINDYYSHYTAFWNLDEALPLYAPKTKAMLGEDFLNGAKINGKLYAIPNNGKKGEQYGLIVREDIVKKYKMDLSKVRTLEDMRPFFTTIKKQEPDIAPLLGNSSESGLTLLPYQSILPYEYLPGAVKRDSLDYKVINQYTSEEMIAYYRLMRKYYLEGLVKERSPFYTWDYSWDYEDEYMEGKFFAAVETLDPERLQVLERIYGYKYISVPLTKPYMQTENSTSSMHAISKTSKYPERALMLLEQVNIDPQLNNLINFGIEGLHYEIVGKNGTIKIIRGTENEEAYNPGIGWVFPNRLLNHLYVFEDLNIWKKVQAFNNQMIPSRLLGFNFDSSPVADEVEACKHVFNNYGPRLEAGVIDPDIYVPIMQKEFKEAGVEKIIAEMQRQLDEWRSIVK